MFLGFGRAHEFVTESRLRIAVLSLALNVDFLQAGLDLKLQARVTRTRRRQDKDEDVSGAQPETVCQLMCSRSSMKTRGHAKSFSPPPDQSGPSSSITAQV